MSQLFLISTIGLVANILAVLSVLIYAQSPPPLWMAWPIPPLILCFAVGAILSVMRL